MKKLAEMLLGDLLYCLARTGYVKWRNMLWGELVYDMIVFVNWWIWRLHYLLSYIILGEIHVSIVLSKFILNPLIVRLFCISSGTPYHKMAHYIFNESFPYLLIGCLTCKPCFYLVLCWWTLPLLVKYVSKMSGNRKCCCLYTNLMKISCTCTRFKYLYNCFVECSNLCQKVFLVTWNWEAPFIIICKL